MYAGERYEHEFDHLEISHDVEKIKKVISQVITFAERDYPFKDSRNEYFKNLLSAMFLDFESECQEAMEEK